MSGITSSTGIFSGIDSGSIIEQLLAIEARPKQAAQARKAGLQLQQTAFLDLNSRLANIRDLAKAFRTDKAIRSQSASSSNTDVLTATADTSAAAGVYSFIVDRLVSTQQSLSRGFADKTTTGLNAGTFTFESAKARLDRDVFLSDLKGGDGISRGKIIITDAANATSTIDLSKAVTVQDVLDAINGNGTAKVKASIVDDKFVLTDTSGGGGTMRVENGVDSSTASSLGIAGSAVGGKVTGSSLTTLTTGTTLASLNDGNGVLIKSTVGLTNSQFTISELGTSVDINLGDVYTVDPQDNTKFVKTSGAVSTLGEAVTRINTQLAAAGKSNITAKISSDGKRLELSNANPEEISIADKSGSTTAKDLGIAGDSLGGVMVGRRVVGGLNTTLLSSLNGGSGLGGSGAINFTTRDGFTGSVTLNADTTLSDAINAIQTASGTGVNGKSRLSVSLNQNGTGLVITDNTGSTSSNLIITGTTGNDTAASLGISTGASGVASTTVSGTNLQKQYLSGATLLSSFNNGKGVGTGSFTITDSTGAVQTVSLTDDIKNVNDLIGLINSRPLAITARINADGDGIEIVEKPGTNGTTKIKISDTSGSVAKSLNLSGEATSTGVDNKISGSFERKLTFDATDTLQKIAEKINSAAIGVSAAIVQDGSGATPFRLSLTATNAGRSGRVLIDTGSFDLGLQTLEAGEDSRAFFGSTDPAKAVAITGTSNTLDNVLQGVKIDLKSKSTTAVNLTVSRDLATVEKKLTDFVTAFNSLVDRLNTQTKYDTETKSSGPLLGDSTALSIRSQIYDAVQAKPKGVTGKYQSFASIGISVGTGGKLSLNTDTFRKALADDPANVEDLLAARDATLAVDTQVADGVKVINDPDAKETFTKQGVFSIIEELAKSFVDSTKGVLATRKKTLDDNIKAQDSRIAAIDAKLENKRQILQAQFLNMEKAIGSLKNQQNSLGTLGT
ncbi:MAG: flagellar filament capping protein FliD [Planctomycetota bacterium]|nr:flagellar filament capping protein FliD [Planctomycetota bacterium]